LFVVPWVNSTRIVIIAIVIAIALALGAWLRLTIAVAHGEAATGIIPPTTHSKTATRASTAVYTAKRSPKRPTRPAAPLSPQQLAQSQLSSYGWNGGQWTYLYQLWERESGWSSTATNPTSGAYGIAQALPATQMNSVSGNWKTDPATQISWGMNYIKQRYGDPQAAWAHEEANGWY
jgi:hypothetical protein